MCMAPASMLDRLVERLQLCCSLALLPPRTVCVLRCCCKELHAARFSWAHYKHLITLDISQASATWWLWRNISSIRHLKVENASQWHTTHLLRDAKALTDFKLQSCSPVCVPPPHVALQVDQPDYEPTQFVIAPHAPVLHGWGSVAPVLFAQVVPPLAAAVVMV